MAPRYAVSDADDPFKKYWWAILLGIGFTALWLLMPMLGERSIGSTAIDTSKPKVADGNVEQSLTAADAGSGIDLSMDGTGHKRKDDAMGSSLFLPADETPAAGAAPAAAAASGAGSTSLASALKKVSEGGGWGEKAQRGFNQPKLGGGGLSGMGAASGGSAGSASAGSSAFGSGNARVGFGSASGLSGNVKDTKAPGVNSSLAALKGVQGSALEAARSGSMDSARAGLSAAFDGGKGGAKIGGGGGAMSGAYAGMDTAAPLNLKLDDPKLNEKKLEAPPPVDDGASKADDAEMAQLGQQMAMQIVGGVIGAMIGGPVGGIVSNAIMKAVENVQQRHEAEAKKQVEEHQQRTGSR